MIYAKWDVDMPDGPELGGVDYDALGMLGCAIGYCRKYETDGFIPSDATVFRRRNASKVIEKLKRAKQLIEAPGGYYLPEYLRSNESKEGIEIARLSAKERKARWKAKNETGTDPEHVPERVPGAFGTNSHSHSHSHSDLKKGEVQERETQASPPDPPPEDGLEPSREDEYRKAYETGIAAGKGAPRFAMPRKQAGELHQAMLAYARGGKTGKLLRGDRCLEWIRVFAEDFARWLTHEAKSKPQAIGWYSSYGPIGFLKWLNEQGE